MNLFIIKILLVAVNFILFCIGSCLLTVGYVLEFQTEVFTGYLAPILKSIPAGGGTGSDVWTLYNYATISFIVVGSLMVLIGMTGCLLATCPNKVASGVYLSSLGMVILYQGTWSAILIYTDIDSTLTVSLRNSLLKKYAGDEAVDEYSQAWNYVFVQFDCCAVESYGEFDITVYWNRKKNINGNITKVMIPETCCKMDGEYPDQGPPYDSNCTLNATTDNSYFDKGCYQPIQDYLWYYHKLLIFCECCPLPLEVVAMVFAVMVTTGLRDRKKVIENY